MRTKIRGQFAETVFGRDQRQAMTTAGKLMRPAHRENSIAPEPFAKDNHRKVFDSSLFKAQAAS